MTLLLSAICEKIRMALRWYHPEKVLFVISNGPQRFMDRLFNKPVSVSGFHVQGLPSGQQLVLQQKISDVLQPLAAYLAIATEAQLFIDDLGCLLHKSQGRLQPFHGPRRVLL